MKWKVVISAKERTISLPDQLPDNVPFEAQIDGRPVQLRWQRQTKLLLIKDSNGSGRWSSINLRAKSVAKFAGESDLNINAEFTPSSSARPIVVDATVSAFIPGQESRSAAASKKPKLIRSQITGKVLKVLVKPGDQVTTGDTLMIIEAMKMENRVLANLSGAIVSVKVSEGETVASGAELIRYKQG